jgi:hypothetical protein
MLSFLPLVLPLIAAAPPADPCVALDILDAQRSVVFATADPGRLSELYVVGSAAGEQDRRVLEGYRQRGLRVMGADLEVLTCRVLWREGSRVRVAVTDRLRRSWALDGAGQATALPRDQATPRTLTLRVVESRWRIE